MKPYNTEESKKEQVERMFDNIAPQYDRLNHVMSFNIDRVWRRRVVRRVRKVSPERILDVATGTGDLAIAMARKMTSVRITGADLSEEMLRIGRAKVSEAGLSERVAMVQSDAENMEFADGEFDVATAAFGVRNFQDLPAGLREISRVLRKEGEVFILEFSTPRNKLFGALYWLYSQTIMPWIGRLVSKDAEAYKYLPDSIVECAQREEFLELMREAGFTDCKSVSQTCGVAQIYCGRKK